MKIVDPWNQAVSGRCKGLKQPQQVAAYVVIQLGEGTQRQGNKESAGGPQILYLGWRGWSQENARKCTRGNTNSSWLLFIVSIYFLHASLMVSFQAGCATPQPTPHFLRWELRNRCTPEFQDQRQDNSMRADQTSISLYFITCVPNLNHPEPSPNKKVVRRSAVLNFLLTLAKGIAYFRRAKGLG